MWTQPTATEMRFGFERGFVVPEVAGSKPVTRPNNIF